jgi:hypothetical protein
MRNPWAIVAALSAMCIANVLPAQGLGPTASVGIALPTGGYAMHRAAGPVLRAGLALGERVDRVGWRLEGEAAWFPDNDSAPSSGGGIDGDLRSIAAIGSLVAGPRRRGLAPYVIVGGGPQWIRVRGAVNPYGTSLGLRAGVGLRFRGESMSLLAELAGHAVLSDFGTREYTAGTYVPLTIGVVF